ATARRVIVAPDALASDVLTRRWEFGSHLRPVAFQLLSDQLGETGHRPLPHLGACNSDDNGLVRADHDPGVDLRGAVLCAHHLRTEWNLETEREASTKRCGTHNEGAAIYFGHGDHGYLLRHASAAA